MKDSSGNWEISSKLTPKAVDQREKFAQISK